MKTRTVSEDETDLDREHASAVHLTTLIALTLGLTIGTGCAWMPFVSENGQNGQPVAQSTAEENGTEETVDWQASDGDAGTADSSASEEAAPETVASAEGSSASAGGTQNGEDGEMDDKDTDETEEIVSWLRISEFDFSYTDKKESYPSVQEIVGEPVTLGDHPKGYAAPDQVGKGETTKVDLTRTFPESKGMFTAKAVRVISSTLLSRLKKEGYMGVLVSPHPEDISKRGKDRRSEDRTSLRIVFHIARVGDVRTVARGERLTEEGETTVNHPAHSWILEHSPVKAGEEQVLDREALSRYVNWLNRKSGRRADLSVSGAKEDGLATLDYRISESKPWTAYLQISDTGTESSGEIQTRVGAVHNQLTGRDDILSASYVASGLDDEIQRVDDSVEEDLSDISPGFEAASISYDTPLINPGSRTRLKLTGRWSEFTSSDVGLPGLDFVGESWSIGGEVSHNVLQWKSHFVDAFGGVTFKREDVVNEIALVEANEGFLVPTVGLEGESSSRTMNTSWRIGAEANLADLAGTERDEVIRLGRAEAEKRWQKGVFNFTHSMYLEPLMYEDWGDPSTPMTSTLAHEVKLDARAQYTEQRLNPNELFVAGGLYTARGYPESAVSGDSGYTGSLEYRLHLPRLLPVDKNPTTVPLLGTDFRHSPENVFGMPDWDLILKGFVDYGYVQSEDRIDGVEFNETLFSAGVGAELQLMRYLRFRSDLGWVLRELDGVPDVERGDAEWHFVFTLMY